MAEEKVSELPVDCKMHDHSRYASDNDCAHCRRGEGSACPEYKAIAAASSAAKRAEHARRTPTPVTEDVGASSNLQNLQSAPDGWVLVPREPTEAMLLARWPSYHPWGDNAPPPSERPAMWDEMVKKTNALWGAIVAAAPKPNHLGGRLICEALGFDPTNHHNAAKCPYCSPEQYVSPSIKREA